MSFAYNEINVAAAQALVQKISPPHVLSMSSIQVVDRDRDAILIELGGRGDESKDRGEPPTYYALWWKGNKIFFHGYYTTRYTASDCAKDIELDDVRIPSELAAEESNVRLLIEEALTCLWKARSTWISAVNVKFPADKTK